MGKLQEHVGLVGHHQLLFFIEMVQIIDPAHFARLAIDHLKLGIAPFFDQHDHPRKAEALFLPKDITCIEMMSQRKKRLKKAEKTAKNSVGKGEERTLVLI